MKVKSVVFWQRLQAPSMKSLKGLFSSAPTSKYLAENAARTESNRIATILKPVLLQVGRGLVSFVACQTRQHLDLFAASDHHVVRTHYAEVF